jgi:2-desacetyl-2-hydroxyethyl bacteriochlorophyllide A dehydrogenase
MKTKAIVFAARENVVIQDLDVPPPGEHEIQVQSVCSTISSGTEGWLLRNLFTRVRIPFPLAPGYQRSGIVTAVGPEVRGWRVGDRALALVGKWSNPEVTSALGGHIGLANVATDFAYPLSNQVDDVDASSAVVTQVGYNAAQRVPFKAGEWVLVYGDGLVGQCAAQAARAKGARVILVGHRKERLELATRYSADAVVNSTVEEVVPAVRKAAGAKTVPIVLDSVQTKDSQKQYMDLLQPGRGQIVYTGFAPGDHWADMAALQESELTTHFVNGFTRERMEATLALMAAGKIRIRPLITHFVPYTRGPEMYRMILEKNRPFLGITLDWRTDHQSTNLR